MLITFQSGVESELVILFPFHAVIRGWLVRRDSSYINKLRKYHENENSRRNFCVKMPEVEVFYHSLCTAMCVSE